MNGIWLWIAFNAFVVLMLVLDLAVFHRRPHAVRMREAGLWSLFWIALALVFNAGVYHWMGRQSALEFLTGYLIEKSLSVDNLFVFSVIFSMMAVPASSQHRVLFWGILGALIMRGIFILAGAALIHQFEWILYVFAAFLIFTGIRMAMHREVDVHPERNPVVRFARRHLRVTHDYEGNRFFVHRDGIRYATPLVLTLVMIETTDVIFAVDSIPAVFGVTQDPFIVYTSNIFAILGLRALYFVLAGLVEKFYYLKAALAGILVFVGVKMAIHSLYKIPTGVSLAVIALALSIAIVASWSRDRRLRQAPER